ncbi:hypothetical protein VPH184E373B_0151 [Vibrio phage 184E37-3b]|nr:hypothetical protein MYOV056v2_p0132 [Vibrio phage 184E37.3a]QZI89922.1 hypothetical protein MYOV057v1_p0007 [Vibrio phage 184E37.1]
MKDLLNNYRNLAVTRSDYFEPKTKTRSENVVKKPKTESVTLRTPKYTDEQLADRYAMGKM